MTLDEAIRHCINEVYLNQMRGCDECAAEHEQLAKWLTELKQRREAEISAPLKSNADRIRQMTDEELAKLLDYVDINLCNFCAAQRTNTYYDCEEESCEKCVLAWLKQEVSEDAR